MSKKHFHALALAFAYRRPEPHWDANKRTQWSLDVASVADVCQQANPRFDRERFLEACETWTVAIRDGALARVRS